MPVSVGTWTVAPRAACEKVIGTLADQVVALAGQERVRPDADVAVQVAAAGAAGRPARPPRGRARPGRRERPAARGR